PLVAVPAAVWAARTIHLRYRHYVEFKEAAAKKARRNAIIQKLVKEARPIIEGRGGNDIELKIYQALLEHWRELTADHLVENRPHNTHARWFRIYSDWTFSTNSSDLSVALTTPKHLWQPSFLPTVFVDRATGKIVDFM